MGKIYLTGWQLTYVGMYEQKKMYSFVHKMKLFQTHIQFDLNFHSKYHKHIMYWRTASSP